MTEEKLKKVMGNLMYKPEDMKVWINVNYVQKKVLEEFEIHICDCRWRRTCGELPHQDLCEFRRFEEQLEGKG